MEECDFTKSFALVDGAVAFDCIDNFSGWKLEVFSVIVMKEADPHEVVD